ncbi:hypothetical protein [Microbacterium sp. JZ31]|uniref:hypothetical protein n=1 Tax=Microbacterium sp. JZ31 TaxID=1906274 RepID=UPI001932EDCC|nr:hypothetical protein [Microbacterium sp. JZ31]
MSLANTAVDVRAARPQVRPEPTGAPRRRLQAVPDAPARRRPRLGYAIVAFAGAVAIAIAQMSLSVLTTQSSYELAALNQERRAATLQAQELRDEVAGLSSPQNLAASAAGLGMVIDSVPPSSLRLSDGKITGDGAAAGAKSTVDAKGRAAVGNALLERSAVTADAEATSGSAKEDDESTDDTPSAETEKKAEAELPPPLTEGLPSPTTR